MQYVACGRLLVVLALVEWLPGLLWLLPRRPDENIGLWGAIKAMFV